ncbi:hypothetical protein [Pseudomonas helleri]|uniref:hypothetical protein n=1 Tax=Pseudomonas helleri TaxID=1608996 RepID=UPI001E3CD12F|nr:hypothetical protein [Pseudomonas helleri]
MYTGIVQGTAQVTSIELDAGHTRIVLAHPLFDTVDIGASVSVNGTCLTVTAYGSGTASFDIHNEQPKSPPSRTCALTSG